MSAESTKSEESFEQTLTDWRSGGTATLTVRAVSIERAVQGVLDAVLDLARGERPVPGNAADEGSSLSAPIRGQGDSYGDVLFELANDLLAQLDSNGVNLSGVRLDGMLETDTGGYSAWGYILGEAGGGAPPVTISLAGTPAVSQDGGVTTIAAELSRNQP